MPWNRIYSTRFAEYPDKSLCELKLNAVTIGYELMHLPHNNGKEIEDAHATVKYGQLKLVMHVGFLWQSIRNVDTNHINNIWRDRMHQYSSKT
jgi:hypothetical protein